MPVHDIIVIGAGAGGEHDVKTVLSGLAPDLHASVFIVQHLPGHTPSELVRSLNRSSPMLVTHPKHGERIEVSRVYLAPPNRHMLVADGAIILGNGPKENRSRPAIDALFRTAAHAYGERVAALILSGTLNDGTSGLMSVKRHGGISIVLDPEQATFDGMSRSAIALTSVDHILAMDAIAPTLTTLVGEGAERRGGSKAMAIQQSETDIAETGTVGLSKAAPGKIPSSLTCPACGGAVWQVQDDSLTLFKCHVGHSYTAELLLEEQSEAVDAAAWVLLRSLEENVFLRRQLASWARLTDRASEADFHEQQALSAAKQAESLKAMVLSQDMGGD